MNSSSKMVDIGDAVDGVSDGATVLVGGWGTCGTPDRLIAALVETGVRDLTVIITGSGPVEPLFETQAVSHCITSFGSYAGAVGAASAFERCFQAGNMTVELCSQGVLAERIRAGGAGIPAFYVEQRMVGPFQSTGETREIDGKTCVLETALHADLAVIGASIADPLGNLSWRDGERNFNEPMAYAADLVVVEAFEMYDVGWLPAEHVMVPGLVVDRVIAPPE
ncbi:MAG: 3-oxoacid CoA-transferase A subunit [Acidimicrobiales bacterium]|jgi:3-oxoadipate CoA-transferase, alpha subunit